MTQEDKELLLKDLCARLPYGVMVREDTVLYDDKNTTSYHIKKLSYVLIGKGFSRIKGFIHDYEYIYRPYLFPLSSMTEEQKKEFLSVAGYETREEDCGRHTETYYYDMVGHDHNFYPNSEAIDWLNKNHFDYRGLIEKGLALDATGKGVYKLKLIEK